MKDSQTSRPPRPPGRVGILVLAALILLLAAGCQVPERLGLVPTITPEPIVPTRTPAADRQVTIASQGSDEASVLRPIETATNTPAQPEPAATAFPVTANQGSLVTSDLARFGVGIARELGDVNAAAAAGLPFGSALNWNVELAPEFDPPLVFWQMVRTGEEGIRRTDWESLAAAIDAAPSSFWLIGNEPDVRWQDNVTPQRYAEIYHEVYTFIKARDPGAKIVIGGVSQPTPLRRAYLDIVLDTYEANYGHAMPIDVWNVHAFVLREEKDSWGVDIPPGMEGAQGILYEIDDHDDLEILKQNLIEFRRWMAQRGYGGAPLVISEYGILMPEDYGFPLPEVADFMTASFDLFYELRSEEGYAPDGGRLVQWWFWYSLYDPLLYSTGNLWEADTGKLTVVGEAWARYVTDLETAPEDGRSAP